MTAVHCPRVRVLTPPAYCIGRSLEGPRLAPEGSEATRGRSSIDDEELIYKTGARRVHSEI